MRGRISAGRHVSLFVMGLCVVAIGAALLTLGTEIALADAQHDLRVDVATIARGEVPPPFETATAGDSPRLALVEAIRLAQRAQAERSPELRKMLIDGAQGRVDHALASRPRWGEAAVAAAYIQTLRSGRLDRLAVAMLARSYDDTAFLKDATPWRVRAAAAAWSRLPARARNAAVDEAVWYARWNDATAQQMMEIARSSPIYGPFMLRWRAVRDADPH